jgi:hypothetical protein
MSGRITPGLKATLEALDNGDYAKVIELILYTKLFLMALCIRSMKWGKELKTDYQRIQSLKTKKYIFPSFFVIVDFKLKHE